MEDETDEKWCALDCMRVSEQKEGREKKKRGVRQAGFEMAMTKRGEEYMVGRAERGYGGGGCQQMRNPLEAKVT